MRWSLALLFLVSLPLDGLGRRDRVAQQVAEHLREPPEGGRVSVSVADTGRGIPPEHLPLIWERFHRVDPSRDRASGGMGIGLALVRQLVRAMGGEVEVDSELGRG